MALESEFPRDVVSVAASPHSVSVVGFDSAWTDNPKAPGAVAIIRCSAGMIEFVEPALATFEGALRTIEAERRAVDLCLVAIDQPTIVPNTSGMRPVDRLASSFISWLGGGVQPANRSKLAMFGDDAPIWRFKAALAATEDPEASRTAREGCFVMEVFPALALAGIEPNFCQRLGAPRYNPGRRRTFTLSGWQSVLQATSKFGQLIGVDVRHWVDQLSSQMPRKSDQDKLDAVICALIGWHWLASPRTQSVMLGDLEHGYMIAPCLEGAHERVQVKARILEIPIDGRVPS